MRPSLWRDVSTLGLDKRTLPSGNRAPTDLLVGDKPFRHRPSGRAPTLHLFARRWALYREPEHPDMRPVPPKMVLCVVAQFIGRLVGAAVMRPAPLAAPQPSSGQDETGREVRSPLSEQNRTPRRLPEDRPPCRWRRSSRNRRCRWPAECTRRSPPLSNRR
jgi:hypothetical protein